LIKLIIFDLDNVLIDGEAIDEIGKLAGVEEEISDITRKAMEGKLDFETALKKRVSLLKGTSLEDVRKTMEGIPFMEGAEETLKELKKRGYKIATISGSFEIIANRIKDQLGLDYAFSNILHEENGILTGEVSGPLVNGSKVDVLKQIIKMEDISTEECAAVGDAANDISMLKEAKLGIAFNAKPILKEIADIVIEDKDLRQLIPLFTDEIQIEEKESLKTSKLEVDVKKLLDEKKEHEKKIAKLTEERDKLNQEAKCFRELRDNLNTSLKENLDKAVEYRNKRNKINEEVEKYKKKRDQANRELKNLEWKSGKRDIIKVKNEIKKIDKTIETRVLDIKKENELVKEATDLRRKLQKMQKDEIVQKEAIELKKISESYHAKVVELSENAQSAHEEMVECFRKTDDIRSKADDAHKKFIETRENASRKHEDLKAVLADIHKIKKSVDKIKVQKLNLENEIIMKKNIKEKALAEGIYEKFKEGKKLTTDELLLLQKHNIV